MFGAIPKTLRPTKSAERAVRWVRKTFYKVRVKPGSAVFHGLRKHDLIERKSCLIVVGVDGDGEIHVLHETYPRCQYPNVRWFNDNFNLLLNHSIGVGRIDEVSSSRGAARVRARSRLQQQRSLDRLSTFFCQRSGLAEVFIAVNTSSALYKTGETKETADLLHGWSCADQDRVPVKRLGVKIEDGYPIYTYYPPR